MGRPRTCECGTCKTCRKRASHRAWYDKQTAEKRRAMRARRNPETAKQVDRKRHGNKAYMARKQANAALRRGVLKPQPCEDCGAKEVEMHHENYDLYLAVTWLCGTCHVNRHHPTAF